MPPATKTPARRPAAAPPANHAGSPQPLFAAARAALNAALVERGDEIDLVLTGLIAREHALLVGPPGCLRGDVPIYDPVDGSTKTVKERWKDGREFHVIAWDHDANCAVVAKADAPWKYPVAKMVELTLSNGASFAVTLHHRLFDGESYRRAREIADALNGSHLPGYDAFRLPTIAGICPRASREGAPRSTGTAEGFSAGRSSDLHPDDALPHPAEDSDRCASPSPAGYGERSRLGWRTGAPAGTEELDPHGHGRLRLSMTDSSDRTAPRTVRGSARRLNEALVSRLGGSYQARAPFSRRLRSVDTCRSAAGAQRLSTSAESFSAESRGDGSARTRLDTGEECQGHSRRRIGGRSPSAGLPTARAGERCDRPATSCATSVALQCLTKAGRPYHAEIITAEVISAKPVSAEPYYDFCVPVYHNYVACGVIHHNTAKSLTVDAVRDWIGGARRFVLHCTKDTTRNVAFGPIKLSGLKEDRTERALEGGAADAHLLVLEEVFKAGPAVLDMFLMLLNERVYKEGLVSAAAPLRFALGVSNEWSPEGCEAALAAFFDRFLLRKEVRPVSGGAGRKALLARAVAGDPCRPAFPRQITLEELDRAHTEAAALPWSDAAKKALWEILEQLGREGVRPGDRRTMKAVGVARAYAYLLQASEVLPEHLEVLAHVLWNDPGEQAQKAGQVVRRIANPLSVQVMDYQIQAESVQEKETDDAVAADKLKDLETKLGILRPDPRRDAALDFVREALKDRQYKLIHARRD